ncbi:hypothetical protein MD484_g1413, partial [Candolleomyces efflorescens]
MEEPIQSTQDSDSMDIDLPMYRDRPGSLGRSEVVAGVITWQMEDAQEPVDLPALTDILRRSVVRHLQKEQPSNPFANVGPDRFAAFVDSNPGLKQKLEAILQNQSNAEALLRPIVAFFLHPSTPEVAGAYPPPDEPLVDIFKSMTGCKDTESAAGALHLFFAILFSHIESKVDTLGKDQLAVKLRTYLAKDGCREQFYREVRGDFEEQLKGHTAHGETRTRAQSALSRLVEKLPPPDARSNKAVSLLLSMDEAHTLSDLKIGPGSGSLYDVMVKVAADYWGAKYKFFILFLSTSSQLRRLAPPPRLAKGARQIPVTPVAPFTEMPFDCHPRLRNPIQPDLELIDIQQFEFITRFGRPLWWTCLAGDRNQETRVRQLAASKLTGLSTAYHSERTFNPTAKLAILDTLLNLEYHPSKIETNRLMDDMVASHMRTAFFVPIDCMSMYTGYPSEPVLAEAALDIVENFGQSLGAPYNNGQDSMVALFASLDQRGKQSIVRGQRGEIVGKIILLRAYMASIKEEELKGSGKPGPLYMYPWRNGCSLLTFLRNLTAEAFYDDVKESRPDNVLGGDHLEDAFKNAWVRFTHFARGTDDSAMTTSMAWVAFVRGMAMVGWYSQDSVDLHIPVLLDKDRPISESNMTGILVQIKLRGPRSLRSKVSIDAGNLGYFPPPGSPRESSVPEPDIQAYRNRPYIALLMELGKTTQGQRHSSLLGKGESLRPQKKHKSKPSNSSVIASTAPTGMQDLITTHPRYSLFFYGRSHKIYRCVPDDEATLSVYDYLLKQDDLLDTITYPKTRDQSFVYRLKPSWTAGMACFDWVKDAFLNDSNLATGAHEAEEVVIGRG